jgi:microcystin-dependent protein
MAYVITNTRGQAIATILTGEENTTATDLTLIGQNYIEFGLAQNENFVYLLENFAAPTPPLHPIQGQLWFDTANSILKLRLDVNTWASVADQGYVQAQKISPAFTGVPTAPTAAPGTNTTQLATTAFVNTAVSNIDLSPYARLDGATFTGNIFAPTPALGTVSTRVATTEFARSLFDDTATSLYVTKIDGEITGNARAPTLANIFDNTNRIATTGWVQNLYGNVTVSLYAPKVDPVFQGVPTTPTASVTTANTQIASTAFVHNLFGNVDLSPYAPKASPVLTGIPRSPTANASDNSTQIATTEYVQLQKISPAFTGSPTAPTAPANTANTQIATTAFVSASIAEINASGAQELAGSVKLWISATAPDGWALCNGEAVSRTLYPTLFTRIGTTYGAGDGSTTFNLPNLSARFPVGAGAGYNIGSTGGFADASVISHTHATNTSISITNNTHRHQLRDPVTGATFFAANDWLNSGTPGTGSFQVNPPYNTGNAFFSPVLNNQFQPFMGQGPSDPGDASWYGWTDFANTNVSATATTSVSAPDGSVSGAGRNIPPYQVFYYIIKMSDDGSGGGTLEAGAGIDIATGNGRSTITNTGVKNLIAGAGIGISGTAGNLTLTNTGSLPTLIAGQGIGITTSNSTYTITNTVTSPPVVAGSGIAVVNTPGGAVVSANVTNIVPAAGSSITVTNNNGVFSIGGGGGGGGTGGRIAAFGSLTRVSGITSGNALVPGSGFNIASATYNGYFTFVVTFATPMPDNNYKLLYSVKNQNPQPFVAVASPVSRTGFTLGVSTGISRTDQPLPTVDFIVVSGTDGGGGGGGGGTPAFTGATWQTVEKVAGTTYTNNTGQPLQVSISALLSSGPANYPPAAPGVPYQNWFFVNDQPVAQVGGSIGGGAIPPAYVYAIVPPGGSYRLASITGVSNIVWRELSGGTGGGGGGGSGLGFNQSWQDVLSSRTMNTTYTNTTLSPIQVAITVGSPAISEFLVDNVNLARVPPNITEQVTAIVPPGSTYRLNQSTLGIVYWAELR